MASKQIKKYNFKNHNEVPNHIALYIMDVADVESIEELAIEDINGFINGQDDWLRAGEEDELFDEVEQMSYQYRSVLVH